MSTGNTGPPQTAKLSVRAARRGPREERGAVAGRIITIARASFAEHGYAGTSTRAVARDAGVDSALIAYYFGSKRGLLEAALTPPEGWAAAIAAAGALPIRQRGAGLVRVMLESWDNPATAEFLRAIILTATHEPVAMARLRQGFSQLILGAVSANLTDQERQLRASLCASQIAGIAMTRYVWKVGAIASIPSDQVIELVAPTIQRYLSGKITPR